MRRKMIFLTIFITTLSLVVINRTPLLAQSKEKYEDLQIFARVLNLVQQYYVEEVDAKKLIYGGVKGMLGELDPHTNFLPPEIFKEFENETSGEFGGLGIEISLQNGILTVLAPIEDTPAWKAGIQAGDKIVSINGESTKGFSLVEAAQRMRGKKSESVRLGIFREGFEQPKEFTLTREVIKIKSVKYTDLQDGFAYVKITSFIERTSKDLESVLENHQKKYKSVRGLVLDLRNNPGGLLDQAIKVGDLFLEEGIIVSTIGRNKKAKEVVYAKKEGTYPFFPVVVLINEYSASASEIVAGALQDNKRALIMGEKSFGKGSVQSVVKLGDGSGLKLTVARYYTPNGTSIQAEGIRPDVALPDIDIEALTKASNPKSSHREKDMKGHLVNEKDKGKTKEAVDVAKWYAGGDGDDKKQTDTEKLIQKDFQIFEAYNYLKTWEVFHNKTAASTTAPTEEKKAKTPAVKGKESK